MNTTTARPTAQQMRVIENMARKEHGRRAANEGWTLTCTQGNRPGSRISFDLDTEQPVLVHGHMVAWATGIEIDDTYEVKLGSIWGPTMYVRSVLPCTESNLEIRKARALAAALHQSLGAVKDHTEDLEAHGTLTMLRSKIGRVMGRLDRF